MIPTAQNLSIREIVIGLVLAIVTGNLMVLDLQVFKGTVQKPTPLSGVTARKPVQAVEQVAPQNVMMDNPCATCPAQIDLEMGYIKKIQAALSITPTPTLTLTPTPRPTLTPTFTPTPTPYSSLYVKEYYVPFSSGSGQGSDWTDVPGMQTSINTSLYPAIKLATFEASVHTPTGNQTVDLRLYNITDNVPVANSDISWSGGGEQYISSTGIKLSPGNKLYKIQMKTQLQYTSYVDTARIHIVLY